jgi:hypothetical protein
MAWSEEYRIVLHGVKSIESCDMELRVYSKLVWHEMKSIVYTHKARSEEFKIVWQRSEEFKIEWHGVKRIESYGME